MKIDSIDVYHVAHPMREPWTTAYGSDEAVHGLLVRLTSGGHAGWGESNPLEFPAYTPEYARGAFDAVTRIFAPRIVSREMETADDVLAALSEFRGNNFAKASLEIAWWALQSEVSNKPLHTLLGGTMRNVSVGEAFGITSDLDELLQRIQRAFDAGYQRIKLKVRPERDLELLAEVRRAFPEGQFHIDGNCGYTLSDLPMFERLDKLELAMIEQPLGYGDLLDHARLQRAIATPICIDESCMSVAAASAAIELGSCKIMNIKPPRVGGLANAKRILDLCVEAHMPAWVGSMLETSIGTASNLAFASLPGITLPCDAFPSMRFYGEEISDVRLDLTDPGTMRPLATTAGTITPNANRLHARTVCHAAIGRAAR